MEVARCPVGVVISTTWVPSRSTVTRAVGSRPCRGAGPSRPRTMAANPGASLVRLQR